MRTASASGSQRFDRGAEPFGAVPQATDEWLYLPPPAVGVYGPVPTIGRADVDSGNEWKLKGYEAHRVAVGRALCRIRGVASLERLNADLTQDLDLRDRAPFGLAARALVDAIATPNVAVNTGASRDLYRELISRLRSCAALCDAEPAPPSFSLLLRQCARAFFTGFHGRAFFEELLAALEVYPTGTRMRSPALRGGNVFRNAAIEIRQQHFKLEARGSALAGRGAIRTIFHNVIEKPFSSGLGFAFDPTYSCNPPYLQFELSLRSADGALIQIQHIRMGTPTLQTHMLDPVLTPEAELYLSGLGAGAYHLYVNRQRRGLSFDPSDVVEGQRSTVLETVNRQPRACAVTIPADGALYTQERGSQTQSWAEMRAELVDAIVGNTDGFFIPSKMRAALVGAGASETDDDLDFRFRGALTALLDELHEQTGAPPTRPRAARRAFLFHFVNYTLLVAMLGAVKASSYNMTCKDGVDRAAAANGYLALLADPGLVDEGPGRALALGRVFCEIFGPALWAVKRAILAHRLEDLLSTLDWLAECQSREPGFMSVARLDQVVLCTEPEVGFEQKGSAIPLPR